LPRGDDDDRGLNPFGVARISYAAHDSRGTTRLSEVGLDTSPQTVADRSHHGRAWHVQGVQSGRSGVAGNPSVASGRLMGQ
jgi:hypothetical protein